MIITYPAKRVVDYWARLFEELVVPHFDVFIEHGYMSELDRRWWERFCKERRHLSDEDYAEWCRSPEARMPHPGDDIYKLATRLDVYALAVLGKRFGPPFKVTSTRPSIEEMFDFRDPTGWVPREDFPEGTFDPANPPLKHLAPKQATRRKKA